jgi:hypothetical protein
MRFEKSSLVHELEVHSGKLDQSEPDTETRGAATNRARLTSTGRIWYSRARVKH